MDAKYLCKLEYNRKRRAALKAADPAAYAAKTNARNREYYARTKPGRDGLAVKQRHRLRHVAEPRKRMVGGARTRARVYGVPCTIKFNDFEVPSTCPALGIPLVIGEEVHTDNSPTLDRIVPALGYIPGNVAVISYLANRVKNNGTADQLRAIATWMDSVRAAPSA